MRVGRIEAWAKLRLRSSPTHSRALGLALAITTTKFLVYVGAWPKLAALLRLRAKQC